MQAERSSFVGRKAEMGALLAELDSALRGEGRLVFLVGEPGIGKTRTAARFAAEAEQRGARTVWGRCRAQKGSPEYWPWIQALRACAGEVDAEAEVAAAVSRLRAPLDDSQPERARFDLHDAVTRALSAFARVQPLVVILDDLQWADVGTLRLLEFAVPELASVPVLVVATARSSAPDGGPPLPRGRTLSLAGLARPEIAELLASEMGAEPDAARIESVLAVTAGNPFFVIEMAWQLASGRAAGAGARGFAPADASELLIRRLSGLTDSSRVLLEAASLLGEELDLGTLSLALGKPVAELVGELEAPLALGVVRAVPGALRRYAFVHALIRDALRHALTPGRRAALHLAIGEAIEQQLERQEGDRGERLPALAHHFFEAARSTGDPARAIHYACEAGELALAQAAFEQAVLHFERALEAASVGTEVSLEQRLRFVLGLGLARYAHDAEGGRRLQAEAVVLARRLGPESFADTVLRIAMRRTEVSLLDVDANALLEEALARPPAGPSALRARLMARLASGLYLDRQASFRRRELSHEAVEMARRLGDPATLGFALSHRLMSLLSPDHLADRLATVDEILRDPTTGRTAELEARLCQLDDLTESADRAGFDAAFAAFEQKVEAAPRAFFLWQLTGGRAAMALLEGRFAEGEALASRALALGQRVQPGSAPLQFAQQLLWLRGSQGRLSEVARMVEGSVEKARVVPAWRCALAGLYSHLGRDAEARREFDALAASDFEELPRDSTWITAMTLAADVCVRLADEKRASSLYRKLLPFAGRLALGRPLVVRTSVVDMQLGTLAQLEGRLDEAEAHLRAALAIAEGMRALPFQAEIRYRQAELLLCSARGDREQALALLEQSEQLARAIGMQMLCGWIETARARVVRAGSRLTVAVASGAGGSRIVQERDNVVRLERPDTPGRAAGTFRRAGDTWTLAFDGRTSHFRDMRGLGYLARLLAQPGHELHAVDLAGGQSPAGYGDAGAVLDARARAEYERRLREASEDLAEAERMNDRGRVEALVDEIELLRAEMARGYGIGGRARRAGSTSERARVAVTRAIKYAVDKIDPHDPALAEHLRHSVRTGTFCVYEPSSRDRINWIL